MTRAPRLSFEGRDAAVAAIRQRLPEFPGCQIYPVETAEAVVAAYLAAAAQHSEASAMPDLFDKARA